MKHYIIYVPGISDDILRVQSLLLKLWRLHGGSAILHAMPWLGDEAYQPKLSRLLAVIDRYHAQGHKVSLVGASAGASAILNAYVQRPEAISGVVHICGKINRPEAVSQRTYDENPAFHTALEELQHHTLPSLTTEQKNRLLSLYSPADTTVPHADTVIPGVRERALPALRHGWAIIYAITLKAPFIIRQLKSLAK